MENLSNFFEFVWSMLCDWPLGTVLGVFSIALIIFLLVVIILLLFSAIDSWFIQGVEGVGIIKDKIHTDPYTSIEYDVALKISKPVHREASWSLTISVNDKTDNIEVDEKYFKSKKEGQIVNVTYVEGRISKSLYLKSVNG